MVGPKEEKEFKVVRGLLDEDYKVRPEFEPDTAGLFEEIDRFLRS